MAKIFNSLDMLTDSFQKKVELFLDDAKSKWFNIKVFESFRTQERQQELYKIWRPPTAEHPQPVTWTLESKHLTWQAVDIVFVKNWEISWDWNYQALRAIASQYQIWNLWSRELCHFEDNNLPLNLHEIMESQFTPILADLIKNWYKPVFNEKWEETPATIDDVKNLIEIWLARTILKLTK